MTDRRQGQRRKGPNHPERRLWDQGRIEAGFYDRRSGVDRRTDAVMREWVNQFLAAQRSQRPLTDEDVDSMFTTIVGREP